jgi:hypothetical protein
MRHILIPVLICTNITLNAQDIFVDKFDFFYQISPIYDFKQSVVSLTFDDGYITQFTIGIPILKERNLQATFYLITNSVDSITKSLISKNISRNFEIGSHTVTHPDLVKIGTVEANKELLNSQLFLIKNFGINSGLTMSYPWGIYNGSVKQIAQKYYFAARSTDVGYNSFYSLDRYALKMQNFDEHVRPNTANSWADFAITNHLWLVEMIHGINNVGYSPVDSSVLIEHLDYIKKVEDKIWCSTVSNVIKYIDESKSAEISCDFCCDTVYKIRINDYLNDSIYNQPLSIRINVPANWDSIWISNSNKLRTEYSNKSKFILFNALPDNQPITIRPKLISAPEKDSGIQLIYLNANPFLDNIKLALYIFEQQDIDIVLCDINGKIIIHQKEKNIIGMINLDLNTSGISNGVYFLRVCSNGGDFIIKKLVKI